MSITPSIPPEPALQTAARLLAEGRPAAAAARLADLVAEAPTYAAAHVLRATALEAAGFVDESIVSWGRAAALVPRSPLVHRERERLLSINVADDAHDLPPAVPETPPAAPEPPRVAYVEAEPPPSMPTAGDLEDDMLTSADDLEDALPIFEDDLLPLEDDFESPPSSSTFVEEESALPKPVAPEAQSPDLEGEHGTPEAALEDAAPPSDADELDALIEQLDQAPRIRPDPTYSGPAVSLDSPEVDDMASETLAKIYAAQHQYVAAAVIYEKLAARQPEQADELLDRAAELRRRG